MNYRIHKQLHRTYELMHILERIANNEEPLKYIDTINNKYGVPKEDMAPLFADIQSAFSQIRSEFTPEGSHFQFLFKRIEDLDLVLGWILIARHLDSDPAAYLPAFNALDAKGRNNHIVLSVQDFLNVDHRFSIPDEVTDVETHEDYYRLVEGFQISEEAKYKLLYLYYNFEALLTELAGYLTQAGKLLDKVEGLFSQQLDSFSKWLKQEIAKEPSTFFSQRCNISLPNEDSLEIYPSAIFLNGVTFLKTGDRAINIFIGMHFFNLAELVEKNSCDLDQLVAILKALSDKSKLEILRSLKEGRLYGGQLASMLKLTNATISYHMSNLINLKLVHIEKENNRIYYTLNQSTAKNYLDAIRSLFL